MLNGAGIRALVSLDGQPLPAAALRALQLPETDDRIAAAAIDVAQPNAVSASRIGNAMTLLLGFLDEPETLISKLGLPNNSAVAEIARLALDRFGSDMPAVATGEWSLLDWHPERGLTLMSSAARRDSIFFARSGGLVAVAPSIHTLAQLDFVDRSIDEEGFLTAIGNYRLREARDRLTMLNGISRLPPSGSIVISATGERLGRPGPPEPVPRSRINIHDAVDAATALLRQTTTERLGRLGHAASLLSGGLDSTLIAWLLAQGRAPDARIDCLCSAAPPDSGLTDEISLARRVADHLHLPLHSVVPARETSPYAPAQWRFRQNHGLTFATSHYLYDALGEAAAALGHHALFDGLFGELTVTGMLPLATPGLRLRQLWRRINGRRDPWDQPTIPTFVRLAPHRHERLAELLTNTPDRGPAMRALSPKSDWTLPAGEIMRTGPATELLPGRVRFEYPFRDRRLWRLFSSFPAGFLEHRGVDRAPVRLMLAGHVPESIRLQAKGIGFSPDADLRLRDHAPAARARIAAFRKAGLDDWLDLDWLDETLATVATRERQDLIQSQSAQLTAMTAEFLLWWQEGGR